MEQLSGDGELSTGCSQQCSKQKYATIEEICGASNLKCSLDAAAPGSPTEVANKSTVFNLGAAPFICTNSTSTTTTSTTDHTPSSAEMSVSDNVRPLFPWSMDNIATSTPTNGSSKNGISATGGTAPLKDIVDLNNRLNTMCGLGGGLLQKEGKSLPLPGNILRHLNNNSIMGSLLQETNPLSNGGILAARNANGDYRPYCSSNIINGSNDPVGGAGVPGGNFARSQSQRAPNNCNGPQSAVLSTNGSGGGGPYHYRFDLENNRMRGSGTGGGVVAGCPVVPPSQLATPPLNGNQFQHVRPGNMAIPPNNFGENHFLVTHSNGIIQLKLKDGIEIEMTLDGAIRVVNWHCNVSIALASSSNSAALIHPNGRVLQYHSRVEIMTYDGKNKNSFVRFAKIWYKGISFTSEDNALVYLVDSGGTRTTTDTFMDLRNDITQQVFLTGSTHGPAYDNQAKKEVLNHKYWPALDGTEVHELNGFRIAQTVDGMVRITKANKNILVRTSPGNGSATLTTAFIHCTASLGQTSHLFVRRGERRMHFDGAEFVVRNSGHSAGFDSNNLLRVY